MRAGRDVKDSGAAIQQTGTVINSAINMRHIFLSFSSENNTIQCNAKFKKRQLRVSAFNHSHCG